MGERIQRGENGPVGRVKMSGGEERLFQQALSIYSNYYSRKLLARSGKKQEKFAGTDEESQLSDYAVYGRFFSEGKTEEVGSKQFNEFKLYDMSGNVWEWVEDCWHGNYDGAPTDGRAWLEEEAGDCGLRVIRGGSWIDTPENLRASLRFGFTSDIRYSTLGFRLAQGTR